MSQALLFSFRVIESLSRESAQRQVKSLEPFIISGAVSTRTIYTLTSLLKSSVVQLMSCALGMFLTKNVGYSHKIALNGFDYWNGYHIDANTTALLIRAAFGIFQLKSQLFGANAWIKQHSKSSLTNKNSAVLFASMQLFWEKMSDWWYLLEYPQILICYI